MISLLRVLIGNKIYVLLACDFFGFLFGLELLFALMFRGWEAGIC